MKKRVVHITNIPTPYRIPQLNEISRQFEAKGWELTVIFGALGYARRKWQINEDDLQFRYVVLKSALTLNRLSGRTMFLYRGLLPTLRELSPDVIMVTGFSLATVKVWLRSFWRPVPYLIFSGSTFRPNEVQRELLDRGSKDSLLRRLQRTLLARRASGGIAYGSRARDYLASLGMPRDKISVGINTVDLDFFDSSSEPSEGADSQDETGLIHQLLYVGHLNKGKRVDLLLDAAARLSQERQDFVLRIVGDGPELESLKQQALSLGIVNHVMFEGYKQKEEIPMFMGQALCFLFPSEYDIWGLVINEAMAAGLTCLVSNAAGATDDLISHGETGYVVDFRDSAGVANTVLKLMDDPQLARRIGNQARNFVRTHATLEISAAGFVNAALTSHEEKTR